MSAPSPAHALYAAFLWWVAVLTAQALLDLVGSGAYFGLLFNGATLATLIGLSIGQEALALLLLWVGIAAALRPGALEPGPLARHPGVLAIAVVLLLTSLGTGLLMPTVRVALCAEVMGAEALALMAQANQILAIAMLVAKGVTWATLGVLLWLRLGGDREG